jgi:fibronectin-binding autotransporter adhesin
MTMSRKSAFVWTKALRRSLISLLIIFIAIYPMAAQAVDRVWEGDVNDINNNWSFQVNWFGSTLPAGGDTVVFNGSTVNYTLSVDVAPPVPLYFRADSGFNRTIEIKGNDITLAGGLAIDSTSEGSKARIRFLNKVILSADASVSAPTSGLVFTDPVDNAGFTLTCNSGPVYFYGDLTGAGGLTVVGGTTYMYDLEKTYTGGTSINGGVLSIGADNHLGDAAGGLTFDGGTLRFRNSFSSARDVTINAGGGTIDTNGHDNTLSGIISGAGGLAKTGTGTLTLSGTNTYTGGTSINGGGLIIGADSHLGDAAGGLTFDGGTLRFQNSFSSARNVTINAGGGTIDTWNDNTLSGIISGAGGLAKTGTGTLTLSGTNTYTGKTTISGGKLWVDSDANLGTAPESFVADQLTIDGGTLEFYSSLVNMNANRGIYIGAGGGTISAINSGPGFNELNGAISGPGDLIFDGLEGIRLNGPTANTFSGNTIINGGHIELNKSSGVAAVGGDVILNGGYLYNTSSEQIPDDSSVTINANSWTINTGLTETIDQLSGNGSVKLYDGANLRIGANNGDSTFDGTIENQAGNATGQITKLGSGTLTLSGTNTYSGGTTVSAGTLQGNTSSLQGDITNNASVVFDQGTDSTYAGIMTGTGSLTKENTGILTLTGANTYTGTTTISAGGLFVNGSLSGPVIVNSGARLGGSGTVNQTTVNSGGALAPGNSPGILNTGDLTLNSGSSLDVEINGTTPGTEHDQVNVTGTVTLNSPELNISLGYAPVKGDTYTIINNDAVDAVTGTFNGLTEGATFSFGSQLFQITYTGVDGNDVVISYLYSPTNFAATAVTPNETAVATALDDINPTATGDMETVINELNTLSASQQRSAYNRLSGASHTALAATSLSIMNQYVRTITQQVNLYRQGTPGGGQGTGLAMTSGVLLAAADSPMVSDDRPLFLAMGNDGNPGAKDKWGIWARAYGVPGYRDGDDPASQYDYAISGFSFGGDIRISEKFFIGISGGYSDTDIDFDSLNDTGDVSSYQGGLYGSYTNGPWYVDGLFSYAKNEYDTSREVLVGSINRSANADYDGDEYAFYAEGGYGFKYPRIDFQPLIGLGVIRLDQDGYTESGAGSANLVVGEQNIKSVKSYLGFRASKTFQTEKGGDLIPEVHLAWAHEFSNDDYLVNARFAGSTAGSFVVEGDEPSRNSLILGLRLTAKIKESLDLSVNYDADLSDDHTAHAFTFGAIYRW